MLTLLNYFWYVLPVDIFSHWTQFRLSQVVKLELPENYKLAKGWGKLTSNSLECKKLIVLNIFLYI